MIQRLENDVIQNICVNQVILDLAGCVKELIENSLDAKANEIEIHLQEFGKDCIEIHDNGTGINCCNFDEILQKGATSKFTQISDFQTVQTFGFRGEALNALSQLAQLTIITRASMNEPGWKIFLNSKNNQIEKEECQRAKVGTTVIIQKLFAKIPVRMKDLSSNLKSYYNQMMSIITEYALAGAGLKLVVYNVQQGRQREVVLNSGNVELAQSSKIQLVLGERFGKILSYFEYNSKKEKEKLEGDMMEIEGQQLKEQKADLKFNGFLQNIINSGSGKETEWLKKNYLYFCVNHRPVNPSQVLVQVLNQTYKQYDARSKIVAIVNINIDNSFIDFNLSPDKREIVFTDQLHVQAEFRAAVAEFVMRCRTDTKCIDHNGSKVQTQKYGTLKNNLKQQSSELIEQDNQKRKVLIDSEIQKKQENIESQENMKQNANQCSLDEIKNQSQQFEDLYKIYDNKCISTNNRINSIYDKLDNKMTRKTKNDMQFQNYNNSKATVKTSNIIGNKINFQIHDYQPKQQPDQVDLADSEIKYAIKEYKPQQTENEIFENQICEINNLQTINKSIIFPYLEQKIQILKYQEHENDIIDITNNSTAGDMPLKQQNISDDVLLNQSLQDEKINENNTLNFKQENFAQLKILGQFNLGFIITYLEGNNELYIIDQHAADEKKNYEQFLEQVQFEHQQLIKPIQFNLTVQEHHLINNNMDIFRKNGFNVKMIADQNGLFQGQVSSLPVFKNVKFDRNDFFEIIQKISDGECLSEEERLKIRPSKVQQCIAYKACRASYMVGMQLSHEVMRKIVTNLTTLKSPWNCPHGRPTMIKQKSLIESIQKIKFYIPQTKIQFII